MAGKRILVTGAGGFVGGHLMPALRAAFPDADLAGTGAGFFDVDITESRDVDMLVRREEPDVCIHLAGISAIGAAAASPRRAWEVNLHGTLNVAAALTAFAPKCRLIFASTSEVYGASFKAGVPLDEGAALAPLNLYAATKAAAELALGALPVRVIRLRLFNHTGPGQSSAFVVPAFAEQIARIEAGAPAEMSVGSLTAARDFLDVRDVCAAYVAAVARDAALGDNEVFNIASGTAVKIADVLDMLLGAGRKQIVVKQDPSRMRASEIAFAAGDARKAGHVLGWEPQIPLAQTVRDVLTYFRAAV
jgi:GDP-4-dehydro-6-deoxy-D-mannose reductase